MDVLPQPVNHVSGARAPEQALAAHADELMDRGCMVVACDAAVLRLVEHEAPWRDWAGVGRSRANLQALWARWAPAASLEPLVAAVDRAG